MPLQGIVQSVATGIGKKKNWGPGGPWGGPEPSYCRALTPFSLSWADARWGAPPVNFTLVSLRFAIHIHSPQSQCKYCQQHMCEDRCGLVRLHVARLAMEAFCVVIGPQGGTGPPGPRRALGTLGGPIFLYVSAIFPLPPIWGPPIFPSILL